jgi:hypothetical protein
MSSPGSMSPLSGISWHDAFSALASHLKLAFNAPAAGKALERQSEVVGFRNCLRPGEFIQIELLCTATLDLKGPTFLDALRNTVGDNLSLLPCVESADKARRAVNFNFGSDLSVHDFSVEPISNELLLGRALVNAALFYKVVFNVASVYREGMAPVVLPDFIHVVLKPLIFALQYAPEVDPSSTFSLGGNCLTLFSYEFAFKMHVAETLLKAMGKVINSPAGEREQWSRQTLLTKLVEVVALPSNLRDVHDSWMLSKRMARVNVPAPPLVKPVAQPGQLKRVADKQPVKDVLPLAQKVAKKDKRPAKVVALVAAAEVPNPPLLCTRAVLFHHKLAPAACPRGDCKFSHEVSRPTKFQLDGVLAHIAKQPDQVAALKNKTNYANM